MGLLLSSFAVVALACALHPANAKGLGEPIQPIPMMHNQDRLRTNLGRLLFHDVRLSGNGRISCAHCHDLGRGGMDGRKVSIGIDGKPTAVNAPTVFNAALNFKQFWDGRADSLESQLDQVMRHPVEMGADWGQTVAWIAKDAGYGPAFAASYKDGVTQANIQNAIATFERTLITPNSRFDQYLRGDASALSAAEKTGYAKFKAFGCASCHQGVNIGGNMFQKLGIMDDYFGKRGKLTDADLGRYLVTRAASDRHVFKVPSLRNVATTAPYFHDGSAATLEVAVDVMFRYQLGRVPSAEDRASIIAFLATLTGEYETRQ